MFIDRIAQYKRGMRCWSVGERPDGIKAWEGILIEEDPTSRPAIVLGRNDPSSIQHRIPCITPSAPTNAIMFAEVVPVPRSDNSEHEEGYLVRAGEESAINHRYGDNALMGKPEDPRILARISVPGNDGGGNSICQPTLSRSHCKHERSMLEAVSASVAVSGKCQRLETATCSRCNTPLQWLGKQPNGKNTWYHGPKFLNSGNIAGGQVMKQYPAFPKMLDEFPGIVFLAFASRQVPNDSTKHPLNWELLVVFEPDSPGIRIHRWGKNHGDINRYPMDVIVRPSHNDPGRLEAISSQRLNEALPADADSLPAL